MRSSCSAVRSCRPFASSIVMLYDVPGPITAHRRHTAASPVYRTPTTVQVQQYPWSWSEKAYTGNWPTMKVLDGRKTNEKQKRYILIGATTVVFFVYHTFWRRSLSLLRVPVRFGKNIMRTVDGPSGDVDMLYSSCFLRNRHEDCTPSG